MDLEINQNQCRLCLHENYPLIDLCSEKGNALGISSILKKHFWFLIIDNGNLVAHRKICQSCWTKTLDFHSFYTNIESVQHELYAKVSKSALDTYQFDVSYMVNEAMLEKDANTVMTDNNVTIDQIKLDEITEPASVYDEPVWQDNFDDDDDAESDSESDCKPLVECKPKKKTSIRDIKKEIEDDENDEDLSDESDYRPRKKDAHNRRKRKYQYVRITNRRSYADKSVDEQMRDYFDMKCKHCEIELDSFRMAKNHYRTEHQQKGYLMCCNRKFYRRFQAVDHVTMHINPNHVYKCEQCNKEFMDKYKLKSHMKTHIAKHLRPFKCAICGNGFLTEFQLEKHTYLKHELEIEKSTDLTIVKSEFSQTNDEQQDAGYDGVDGCDGNDDGEESEPKKKKTKKDERTTKFKEPRQFKPAYIKSSTKRDYTDSRVDAQMRQYFNMNCDVCGVDMDTFRGAKGHYRKLHQQEGYITCCGKKFFRRFRAVDHTLRHVNPENGYKCEPCGKEFMDRYTLKCHMETHTPNHLRPFHCNTCEGGFMTQYDLQRHMRVTHYTEEDKKIECKYCGKRFVSVSIRDAHVRLVHEFVYAQICDICAKVFKTKQQLDHHTIAMHTDTPKVQCDICGIWLKNFLSLPKHMRRHKNCDPCECPVCHKIFRNKDVYNDHKRDAHTFKSVNCMLCDKVFKSAGRLREHMTSHTGQNLYTCQYCARGFKRNSTLHTHRKKAHYDEWLRDRKPPRTVGTVGMAKPKTELDGPPATINIDVPLVEPSPVSTASGVIENDEQMHGTLNDQHVVGPQQMHQDMLPQQHHIDMKEQIMVNLAPMHGRHDIVSPQQPLGLVIKEQVMNDLTSSPHHSVSIIIKEQLMDDLQPMQISQDSHE